MSEKTRVCKEIDALAIKQGLKIRYTLLRNDYITDNIYKNRQAGRL